MEKIVDRQFRKTRITIKTSWVDAVVGNKFIRDINRQLKDVFKGDEIFQATGLPALLARTIDAAINSMAKSYLIAFVAITLMMISLLGSLKIGLLSMIPNLIPICFTMGMMGFFKVPLVINSLMIGSIAIGIVVDDTVHFLYNFQKFYHAKRDPAYAVRETLVGVGRALLITSLVLSAGFFITLCSSLKHLVNFGFFTGVTILIALLTDFFLMPALMIMVTPRRRTADFIAKSS